MAERLPDKLLGSQPLCQVIKASSADCNRFDADGFCVYVCVERERVKGSRGERERKRRKE